MPQPSLWLASLALVWGVLYFGLRAYRIFKARFRAEQRRAEQLAELHLATIEALARAIDAKDGTAENHIRRVQLYATAVARELGMSDAEIRRRTAALLHDIGKLAVPEHILVEAGPLTPEEFQKVQASSAGRRGHHRRRAVSVSGRAAHPESPRAMGWPWISARPARATTSRSARGFSCLVDYFDALTSDRPYHKAMTVEAAVALIEQEAGKALDPRCRRGLRSRPAAGSQRGGERRQGAHRAVRSMPTSAQATRTDRSKSSVFNDIAVAHREIYALYQIAQTMGTSLGVSDTMALIASKLSEPGAVLGLRAVPVRREARHALTAASQPAPTPS